MADASAPTDLQLVRQAQQGDESAFTQLYERHLPAVYNRVRYTVPEADVEDVTQDVFIGMMHSLKSFRGNAKFSTWLRTLTNRRIADYYRKRKREHEQVDADVGDVDASMGSGLRVPSDTKKLDDQMILRRAIRRLPENYQEILLMRFAEGLKFQEIATARGQTLEATKSLFRRAIATLRDELGDIYE